MKTKDTEVPGRQRAKPNKIKARYRSNLFYFIVDVSATSVAFVKLTLEKV